MKQSADYERAIDHWDYRVLQRDEGEFVSFDIIECHYNRWDQIVAWSETRPGGDTLEQLEADLRAMSLAAGMANLQQRGRRLLKVEDLPPDAQSDGLAQAEDASGRVVIEGVGVPGVPMVDDPAKPSEEAAHPTSIPADPPTQFDGSEHG